VHLLALFSAIPAGIALIVGVDGATRTTAAAVYVATLVIGLGVSSAYHRIDWSPRMRDVMQRLDHAAIYLLIAGTYVPMCVVALPPSWGVPLLAVVGAGAIVGVVLKSFGVDRARWVGYALYPVLGWAAVAVAPALWWYLDPLEFWLIVAGGLSYTIGFPVLLAKRPDPLPSVFGYHEVWHSFTVVAAVLHFLAVGSMTGALSAG
jgi:hemolysin III